jgi:hypothetical protein
MVRDRCRDYTTLRVKGKLTIRRCPELRIRLTSGIEDRDVQAVVTLALASDVGLLEVVGSLRESIPILRYESDVEDGKLRFWLTVTSWTELAR